jgi:alkylresorcinol/alkylpyrone synthase
MPMRLLHPAVAAVGRALPRHYADQASIAAALRALWAEKRFNVDRLEELFRSVAVEGRHLALPLADYAGLGGFAQRNAAWTRAAVDLGGQAVTRALDAAGLEAWDVDHLFFVTVTGVATPSVDARLVNRLHLRADLKRTPIFGLGCAAGAAGLARAADYLRAYPDEVAVLLSVELCSLTHQRDDVSMANIIASGLFGDGAAAVVLVGARRAEAVAPRAPRVIGVGSVLYPGTEDAMGWDVVEGGFKVVLSTKVPELVREHAGPDVDRFLADHGLARSDVRHWIAHTGGPKVLAALEASLELPREALRRSWSSLARVGNLSSASVLCVLGDLLEDGEARPGDVGVVLAMGPGFGAELALLRF